MKGVFSILQEDGMKILVFSDSHGDIFNMKDALKRHRKAEVVIFCGDGHSDIQEIQRQFPDKMYLCVKGNCDWYCDFPLLATINLCGKKLLITHGHVQSVKDTFYRLLTLAKQEQADIAVFGHTHTRLTTVEDGILLVNPGSIGYHEEYSTIDIAESDGTITVSEYPYNQYGDVVVRPMPS